MLVFPDWLYYASEINKNALVPTNYAIKNISLFYSSIFTYSNNYSYIKDNYKEFLIILNRLTQDYNNYLFKIDKLFIENKEVSVVQEDVIIKPFCSLVHFNKDSDLKQRKLLIIAPLAGHNASLLTDSVNALLPYFDVYVTNWSNARNVPVQCGRFGLNEYIDYVIEFIKYLGEGANVMAVCQAAVQALAATAILEKTNQVNAPKTLILMGGPIDARHSPTVVNHFACERSIEWFQDYMIARVPLNYPGFMRKVYPGFIQLASFMSLNCERHIQSFNKYVDDLLKGDIKEAAKHEKFYDQYLSVLDLPAEFYLESVIEVFQKFSLAKGEMFYHNEQIDLSSIKSCAIFCIEGEKDDITGVGQTKATLKLCNKLSADKKLYHLQPQSGHYGIFSGGKFRRNIAPMIVNFINEHSN